MKYIFFIAFFIMIISCEKSEYGLDKSVFRPDPTLPNLPAYSEWGYNTFGAYYERKVFSYSDYEVATKFVCKGNTTNFILKGELLSVSDDYYSYPSDKKSMSLIFEMKNFVPEDYLDLIDLNDSTIQLTNPDIGVTMVIESDTMKMEVLSGELQFKRAQYLYVDKELIKIILSGYFDFQALLNDEPVSMSFGRFDVGINKFYFFRY